MDKFVEWNIAYLDCFLEEIGDFIEYTWIADDYGYQNGPAMNPEIYKKTVVPRFKKQADFIRKKTNGKVKISNHSCGSTYWMLEDLVYIGVDIQNPMQANAAGNEDAARLKADFGDKITFHGNTDNQGVFHKSKEEVIADALYRIKHLAPGGGYIFSSGHNIQANMPPENMLALFDTAMEYGKCPIDINRLNDKINELRTDFPAVESYFKTLEEKGITV
jgi:uroporphyrinogen decarboxylase